MRLVSPELAAAITAPERTARVRLSVDWDGDGHGGTGSLDDLSGKAASVQVASVLQGDLPDQVAVVEGTAAATVDVDLAKGDTDDELLQAVRYFSPFSSDSPLAGKERLARDVQVDVELLTASGWQGVPLIRGTTRALPVRVGDRTAQLSGVDYRGKLRTKVTLPAVAADVPEYGNLFPTKPGLSASWVVSYALYQAGFPLAPPPSSACRYYAPLHGSVMAFISRPYQGSPPSRVYDIVAASTVGPPDFGEGPFYGATARITDTDTYLDTIDYLADGAAMFDGNGRSSGRIELRTRINGTELLGAAEVVILNLGGAANTVDLYVGGGGGMQLTLQDNGNNVVIAGPSCPVDGQWHLLGVHWDEVAGSAVFNIDGRLTTVSFSPLAANPGTTDNPRVSLHGQAPMAEVMVSTGLAVGAAWQPVTYDAPALADLSQNSLAGIVPGDAAEAWSILQELAAAEQGAMYVDPDGRPRYTTRARLVSSAAQAVQRAVTASQDILELAYDLALDQVANVVTAKYQAISVAVQATAWSLGGTVVVPAHSSATILASYSGLCTSQRFLLGHANTASDGTGTQYTYGDGITPGPVTATVEYTSDTTAEITITNTRPGAVWLVDTSGQPDCKITGDVISQSDGADPPVMTDEASRARYGDIPLDLPSSRWVQTRSMAAGLAMVTAGDLGAPRPAVSGLDMPGDPRLEPYDRLAVSDPDNTGLDLDMWYVGGTHRIDDSGHYATSVVARPARDQFLAGSGIVGTDLVG